MFINNCELFMFPTNWSFPQLPCAVAPRETEASNHPHSNQPRQSGERSQNQVRQRSNLLGIVGIVKRKLRFRIISPHVVLKREILLNYVVLRVRVLLFRMY
jgi:hypothetical protein